jgi:hypothetical protein
MVSSGQNAAFRREKFQFFSQASNTDLNTQIQLIEQRAQTIDYSFLMRHKQALEVEFSDMFHLLQKQGTENKEQFWLYCYYCASLLEQFHRAYEQKSKETHYKSVKEQIKKRLNKEPVDKVAEEGFIQSLYQSFLGSWRNFINSPMHVSQVRDYVAYANLCRIYWVFTRLTFTQGLSVAKELQLIDKLDAILGTHTDVDKIIAAVQAPTGVINYFSVGFFLARFLIDGGLLIKHTFFPSELEKGAENGAEVNKMERLPGAATIEGYRKSYILVDNGQDAPILYYIPMKGKGQKLSGSLEDLQKILADKNSVRLTAEQVKAAITKATGHTPEKTTRWERFLQELYKRHCNFANDLLWATINFLTNFNQVVGISGPVAIYLTSIFLCFDIGMALYKCQLAKTEFLVKKAQYLEEIAQYSDPAQCKGMTAEQRLAHITLLNKQLMELELNWKTKQATFYFVAAAAALLAIGFTAATLLSPPLIAAGMFFVSLVGVAMYLSTDQYAAYQNKSLRLEQAQLTGEHLAVALKEYQAARNAFAFAMAKNTVVPLVLITTYAICWPAALALTVLYLGYELFHAYEQHRDSKAAQQLALEAPKEELEPEVEYEEARLVPAC